MSARFVGTFALAECSCRAADDHVLKCFVQCSHSDVLMHRIMRRIAFSFFFTRSVLGLIIDPVDATVKESGLTQFYANITKADKTEVSCPYNSTSDATETSKNKFKSEDSEHRRDNEENLSLLGVGSLKRSDSSNYSNSGTRSHGKKFESHTEAVKYECVDAQNWPVRQNILLVAKTEKLKSHRRK